jgi:cardiolipin synthase A/B
MRARPLSLIASLLLTIALLVGFTAPTMTSAAGLPPTSPLKLVAEPQAGDAPFLAMIAGAKHSVELTMYELYDPSVERALAAAAHRGVDVRVLLNGGYYSEHEATNAFAYTYLRSHGVHVRYTPTYFALTHQKTLTVDGEQSAIMTLNFDGEYATTRDFAILDGQPADVRAIVAAFDSDWARRRITPSKGSGDLVWSPGAAATTVLRLIASARHSIDLEDEEMDYTPATDGLCAAARRGVDVEVVMTYESDWKRALAQLSGCGVQIRLYHGQSYYIHAKLLWVDGRTALVSSQNLSTTSLDYNRELGIELTAPSIVGKLGRDFASDYAGGSPG